MKTLCSTEQTSVHLVLSVHKTKLTRFHPENEDSVSILMFILLVYPTLLLIFKTFAFKWLSFKNSNSYNILCKDIFVPLLQVKIYLEKY